MNTNKVDLMQAASIITFFFVIEVGVADFIHTQDMTLKTQVILYLIGHLEDYSVDSLALLPPPLRRELLLNVPALDVHKLEGTALFDGIDNEHIWKNLYHNHGYGFSDLYVQRKKSFMSQSPCYEPPDDVVIDHQVNMRSSKFIDYFALPHIPG